MLRWEHSAIRLIGIKRLLVLKNNFGLHFEWLLKTGFTVHVPLFSIKLSTIFAAVVMFVSSISSTRLLFDREIVITNNY